MCNEIGIVTCAAHLKQYRWQQTHDVFQYSFVAERLTGLRLKYTGLRIVYVPVWHVMLMMPGLIEVEDLEDRSRCQNESIDIEDG